MPPKIDGYVNKYAPHKALKIIACGKLTFFRRVLLHRLVTRPALSIAFSHIQEEGLGIQGESGPLRAFYVSRHKWPGD